MKFNEDADKSQDSDSLSRAHKSGLWFDDQLGARVYYKVSGRGRFLIALTSSEVLSSS